jgi:hypothetical protein
VVTLWGRQVISTACPACSACGGNNESSLPRLPPIPSKRSKWGKRGKWGEWGEWGEWRISLNFPRGHLQCPLISELAPSTLQISKTHCCFISQNFHGGQHQPPLSSRCRSAAHQKKYWPILFDPQISGTQPPFWCKCG